MMEITKSYRFEAAHSLPLLPESHKCHHVHGHSYEIVVGVKGPLEPMLGWVQDYAVISAYVKPLIDMLDHKNLNDVMGVQQTTAENLALWFAERLKLGLPWLSRVEVRETPTSNVILLIETSASPSTNNAREGK
jgi:6-pyruvoyltetrahydropterin/6-carboxytetrahydropterin synthase